MESKKPGNVTEFVKTTAIVGGVGAVSVTATNMLLDGTSLTDVSKAFVQTLGHLVLGAAVGRVAPRIGAGIAIGGIVGGAAKLEREVRVRAYIRSLVTPQRAQTTANSTNANSQSNSANSSSTSSSSSTETAAQQMTAGTASAGWAEAYDGSPRYVGR
jgi:hypothetical protein